MASHRKLKLLAVTAIALVAAESRGDAQSGTVGSPASGPTQPTATQPGSPPASPVRSPTEVVQPPTPIADTLANHVRRLAADPRDLTALLGAGDAALQLGDGNAAFSFFARAEDVAPRSAKAKAGMGSALLMMEQPQDALRLFREAVALGIPEAEIGADRGLAHDLIGEPRKAQADYALAMRGGADDETIRRYALSLGISGERDRALAMIDPLLRKRDYGAWRVRAFVLAMNGDPEGARGIARAVMPARAAAAMAPFFSRLAELTPLQKAQAVHLGQLPSNGARYAAIETGDGWTRESAARQQSDAALVPAGEPLGPRTETAAAEPVRTRRSVSREPRRRPGVTASLRTRATPEAAPGRGTAKERSDDDAQPGSPVAVTRARMAAAQATGGRAGDRRNEPGRAGDAKPSAPATAPPARPAVALSAPAPTSAPGAGIPGAPVSTARAPATAVPPASVSTARAPATAVPAAPVSTAPAPGAAVPAAPVSTATVAVPARKADDRSTGAGATTPTPSAAVVPSRTASVPAPAPATASVAPAPVVPAPEPPRSASAAPGFSVPVTPERSGPVGATPAPAAVASAPVAPAPVPAGREAQPLIGPPVPPDIRTAVPAPAATPQAPAAVARPAPALAPALAPAPVTVAAAPVPAPAAQPAPAQPVPSAPSGQADAASVSPSAAEAAEKAEREETLAAIVGRLEVPESELAGSPVEVPTPAPAVAQPDPEEAVRRAAEAAKAEAAKAEAARIAAEKAEAARAEAARVAKTRAEAAKAEAAKAEAAKAEAARKEAAKKEAAKKEAAKKKEPPKPKHPSRHWVQVAGGANKATLPREWARLRQEQPKLFAGQSAWTTPLRATNRLIVGPFPTAAAAQAFVNRATGVGIGAFPFTSSEGQVVESLGGR